MKYRPLVILAAVPLMHLGCVIRDDVASLPAAGNGEVSGDGGAGGLGFGGGSGNGSGGGSGGGSGSGNGNGNGVGSGGGGGGGSGGGSGSGSACAGKVLLTPPMSELQCCYWPVEAVAVCEVASKNLPYRVPMWRYAYTGGSWVPWYFSDWIVSWGGCLEPTQAPSFSIEVAFRAMDTFGNTTPELTTSIPCQ